MGIIVNTETNLEREATRVLGNILSGLPDLRVKVNSTAKTADGGRELVCDAVSGKTTFRFAIQVRSRITPQTALSLFEKLRRLPYGTIPLVYAPVISDRVSELAREHGVGYVDRAGNCWLRSLHKHLLIERQGFRSERRPTPAAADPFSTKSSRVVRAMLSRPLAGWQVRKLAEHPDVGVSAGLAVKVKRALIQEGYAVERDRLLYLRDPDGLLNAWSREYAGPAEQASIYVRGDNERAIESIFDWCAKQKLLYALSGFSAAWRLAPEVRYPITTVYVESRGFEPDCLQQLDAYHGAKWVESGANVLLWRPYDPSVFAFPEPEFMSTTSPLQTYLDLKKATGRGEDAAKAIFEKYLSRDFQTAVKRAEEWRHGAI
jgi:hypothetical protein